MSTRSIVALAVGDGFTNGVYVHSDGYPMGRGPVLFEIATNLGTVQALWEAIDSAHNGGWSYLDATYDTNSLGDRGLLVPGIGLQYTDCQVEDDWRFEWHGTPLGENNGGAEWAYAISPDHGTLTVYKVGWNGGEVTQLAVVRFTDDVDWAAIEKMGYGDDDE